MKVILIFPRCEPDFNPPLGLGYVASVLEKNGIDTYIVDMTFERKITDLKYKLSKKSPDVVGIYSSTLMINDALDIGKLVKDICPNAKVVLGGPHPTILPGEVLKNEEVDIVVRGEGEYSTLELMKALEGTTDIKRIQGISYKDPNGVIIHSPSREAIKSLDEIPFPARHMLPMDRYIREFKKQFHSGLPGTTMIASRGCPYNCSFCQPTLRSIFGKRLRLRSPKKVVDEMEYLIRRYGVKEIGFHDDTFTADKKWVMNVCNEIEQRPINIKWTCNSRCDVVTKKLLSEMYEAGCILIGFGVEAGSNEIRNKVLRKGVTIEKVKDAFRWAKEIGIMTHAFFMIGSPKESQQSIRETVELAKQLDPDTVTFSITMPFPGTDLYNLCREEGLVQVRDWSKYDYRSQSVMSTEFLSREEIIAMQKKAYLEFYLRPHYLFRKLLPRRGFQKILRLCQRGMMTIAKG